MEKFTPHKERYRGRHLQKTVGALALIPAILLTNTACASSVSSAANAGNNAGNKLSKCMDVGDCAMPAPDAVVPQVTLDCTKNAPKARQWAMVTPVKPPKDKDWAFEVNVLGPKATDHNKAWAEVDYKNSNKAGHTAYSYGQGPLPLSGRPAPELPALNHNVVFDETIVKVFTPIIPKQGPEGTVDFSCPGADFEPPANFSKFEVTFSHIVS